MCKGVKKGLKDVKEGKVTRYKSIGQFDKEKEEWKKKHPVLYKLEQTYYSIRRFFIRIIDFFRYDIKYFIQRGKRGYADRDAWNFDYYLAKVISGGIDKLIKEVHGHPCDLKNIRQWKTILRKISKTFKTATKINNDELYYITDYKINTEYKNSKKFKVMTLKQNREYEEGWELFQQYFQGLWD